MSCFSPYACVLAWTMLGMNVLGSFGALGVMEGSLFGTLIDDVYAL